jgi:high-affinity Fe2+/Pb2+ permease
MNNLSWLLYLSDVLPSISTLFGFLGTGVMFLCVVLFVVGSVSRDDACDRQSAEWAEGKATQALSIKVAPIGIILWVVAVVVPAQKTILMIAASEMGETVVKSPEAQEVFADLKAVLKQRLDALKK